MQSELCTRQVTSGDKQGSDTKEVEVERRAEKTANVPEQESSALFCVTVKAGAPTTMECKLCDATNTDICD